jgi:integrase
VRNVVMPLRSLYRHAVRRNQVVLNPTRDLELPAVRGVRSRTASVEEMDALLAPLSASDRVIWATAMLGGLRLGELRALRLENLELNREPCPVISVSHSWDQVEGFVGPKSRAGRRLIPVVSDLRRLLIEHRLALAWNEGLVFGRSATVPFNPSTLYDRAHAAWDKHGLTHIGLHESRHSFRSLCDRARVTKDSVRAYLGHADADVTDRYWHPREEQMADDVALIDAYLKRMRSGAHAGAQAAERA